MRKIFKEFLSLTVSERSFIFFTMLVGFCIAGEYGVTRPVSQSIFLSVFSASTFPAVWLAMVPLNLLIVYLYNHFLPRIGPLKMMATVSFAVVFVHIMSIILLPIFPEWIFFHSCWKDIYVLLMFKQMWSMVQSTIPASRAHYTYGIIFGVGTCGAALGSLVPSFLATQWGSSHLLLFSAPFYLVLFYAYRKAYFLSGAKLFTPSIDPNNFSASNGFTLIYRNRYIMGILFLVMFMQVSVSLIDFQFSHYLEILIPAQDLRTAYCGKLIGLINAVCLVLQFFGGFLLMKLIGLRNSHYLLPLLLLSITTGLMAFPCFTIAALAFSSAKTVDYSLFGILREMLFLPLKIDEKYRAKAVIDVFAHRTSKAFASLLLISLQFFVGAKVFAYTNYLLFVVFLAWIVVLTFVFKREELDVDLAPEQSR